MIRAFLHRATGRLACAVTGGLAAAVLTALLANAPLGVLAGINAAALLFLVTGTAVLWPMDAATTRADARREALPPVAEEVVVAGASLAGLAGIALLLVLGGEHAGPLAAALALTGVFLSWAALHLMYTARYAALYFSGPAPGGIDFNSSEKPCYQDFFYFSFAVGMTYGVTDTAVSRTDIRSVVLRHSLLSYVFGAAVVATAINLVVGVFTG